MVRSGTPTAEPTLHQSTTTSTCVHAGQTGGRPRREPVGWDEVREHNKEEDAWTVVNGIVYNMTPYFRFHPGGAKILKAVMGKDGTNMFNKYHRWVSADMLLEKCIVGALQREPS